MPFAIAELLVAHKAFRKFMDGKPPAHHARYIFPFFAGSYFAYRKVDVARVAAVARSILPDPSFADLGCGYGDFLSKVREQLPSAQGVEKEGGIFYSFQREKPGYISLMPVEAFSGPCDVAFVGWMEPGQDFRSAVSKYAKCIVTTFDAGGQCGINGACEYEEFGYVRVAWWRTPSWIDVNAELMNRYYTPGLSEEKIRQLSSLRSAHNFWYVYARPEYAPAVESGLRAQLGREDPSSRYDFESVLDECGFGYRQAIAGLATGATLWEVEFG